MNNVGALEVIRGSNRLTLVMSTGQFLTFIHHSTTLHGRPPAEAEILSSSGHKGVDECCGGFSTVARRFMIPQVSQEHRLYATQLPGFFGVFQFCRVRFLLDPQWLVIRRVKSLLHLRHQYPHVVISSIQDDA